jgi:PST family polysaccharide transporter
MTNPVSLRRQTFSGARWMFMGQVGRLTFQILALLVLARILRPTDFGLYGMVAAITAFAAVLGDFGLSAAAIQAKTLAPAQKSNLFWINLSVGVMGAICLLFAAKPLSDFYGQPELESLALALAVNFILTSSATQFMAEATRRMRFGILAAVEVSAHGVGFAVAVIVGLTGGGPWALVWQQLSASSVSLVLLAILTGWFPGFPKRAPMRKLMSFGLSTFAVQVLNYLTSSVDSILAGKFLGAHSLGLYDRAFQIYRLPVQQIATPLSRVVLPIVSRIQDDQARLQSYLERAQRVLALVVGAVMVGVALLAEIIVAVVLGPGWENSAQILMILSFGGFFQGLGYVYQWAFLATGKVGEQLKFTIFTRFLMLGLIISGVSFGILGIAAGVAIGLCVNWFVLSVWGIPKTGLDYRGLWRAMGRPLAMHGSAVCVGLATQIGTAALSVSSPANILLGTGAAFFVYGLAIIFSKSVRSDISDLLSFVKRFR